MAYEPAINVFDETQVKTNLVNYFKANQLDALKWANGGNSLPVIKAFYQEVRKVKVFPALSILQTEHSSTYQGDFILIDFSAVFEIALVHGKQEHLTEVSPKYSMAYESMLSNVSKTTLSENSKIDYVEFGIEDLETRFDLQGEYKTSFIQIFQTRALWKVRALAWTRTT